MAGAITALNGYVNSRNLRVEPEDRPFFKLGRVRRWRGRHGGWDEAVEENFSECWGRHPATAPSMNTCLAQKLARSSCRQQQESEVEKDMLSNIEEAQERIRSVLNAPPPCPPSKELRQRPSNHPVSCPTPRVRTFDGSISQKRAFIRDHFNNPNSSEILPLTVPWDTGVIYGGRYGLVHVSALIGRRIHNGRCQLLIRNSQGGCSHGSGYIEGTQCDRPGQTDDVWVSEAELIGRIGDITVMGD